MSRAKRVRELPVVYVNVSEEVDDILRAGRDCGIPMRVFVDEAVAKLAREISEGDPSALSAIQAGKREIELRATLRETLINKRGEP